MRDRDKDCKLLLLPKSTESKEKRAKKKEKKKQTNTSKKRGHSSTPQNSDDTEKNQPPVSKAPLATPTRPPLPVESTDQSVKVKGRLRHGEGARRRTRLPKEEKTQSGMSLVTGAPSPAPVLEVSAQVQESLRWEGVLEDPLEEEKRLEVYKANRRQRYLIHRQALIAADKTPGLNQDSNRDKEDHKVMTLQD